jgi:hypothetical protein
MELLNEKLKKINKTNELKVISINELLNSSENIEKSLQRKLDLHIKYVNELNDSMNEALTCYQLIIKNCLRIY